jgi:hypothetical protein
MVESDSSGSDSERHENEAPLTIPRAWGRFAPDARAAALEEGTLAEMRDELAVGSSNGRRCTVDTQRKYMNRLKKVDSKHAAAMQKVEADNRVLTSTLDESIARRFELMSELALQKELTNEMRLDLMARTGEVRVLEVMMGIIRKAADK